MRVEFFYALPDAAQRLSLELPDGATIARAVQQLQQQAPALGPLFSQALTQSRVGVFGKLVEAEYMLREGDRIECYRALLIDPKESRRRRAQVQAKRRPGKDGGDKTARNAKPA
jgi:putative ubiquitin-RnfH superfamily antitoxin RatB of RatAB toxin-antitoxin module